MLPVSFNAWLLLIVTLGVCAKASAAGFAQLRGEMLVAIIVFSIPAILFYCWVAAGGPGAVLWMWLTGVFSIATKYAEALLSVKYRITTSDGSMAGGPMYVLERGMKQKWLAVIFALLTAVAAFGIGNMVQANSISMMVQEAFNIAPWITGIVMTIFTAVVIIGGIKSIASVCELLLSPAMR